MCLLCVIIEKNRYSDRAGEEYKQSNFDDNLEQFIDKTVENIDKNLKSNDIPFTEQNAITCEEIKQLLKGKVPGLDFLTIEHLIHSDYTLIEKLCFLYNAIIRNKYVPGMFKIGKILLYTKVQIKRNVNLQTTGVLP